MFVVNAHVWAFQGPPEAKEASKAEPEVRIQVKDGTFEMDGKTYRVNDMAALLEVSTLCHSEMEPLSVVVKLPRL